MSVKLMGRYDVINELGQGSQSIVYLAKDSRMSRQIAIKKIGPGTTAQNEAILHEARAASNLHHHNIISLYDLGVVEGAAYLVYAYVEGESLAQVLKRSGAMPVAIATATVLDLLDALASAHGQGVLHLGIKPSNVMISSNGQHFLTDFGIAHAISTTSNAAAVAARIALYMAPETIAAKDGELRSDIYAIGIILNEMLTGSPFLEGRNSQAPSDSKVKVDEKLQKIILKATAKKIDERYSNALEMRQALTDYLESAKAAAAGIPEADISSTLKFLVRRIRSKNDFPAMSGIINEINKIVESDSEGSSKLAQVILQDYSLTNKLLKLVNTVSYSQFGGKINTISKAVSILGVDPVRNIAMSLIVMDFLQNKSQAQDLKNVVISSFFSGIVAVQLSEWKNAQEVEEAMICSMFFNLGRMLAKFYLFDECEEIARVMAEQGVDEEKAAHDVLGISYNELGIGIAKSWNFPDSLIVGMQKIAGDNALRPADNMGRLNVAVNLANELSLIAAETDPKAREDALHKISGRYSDVIDASKEKLSTALVSGLKDLTQRSKVFGIDASQSPMLKNIQVWATHAKNARNADNPSADSEIEAESSGMAEDDIGEKVDVSALLRDGLQDVTNTMKAEYKLNDVLQMVLETIYRGLGFKHVFIFSRDAKKNMMVARFGFGENIAAILPHFHFPINFEADVFHLAIAKSLDIVIEDVAAPNIANKIPGWHAKAIDSRSFLLLPMVINNTAVGLIYADMLEAKKLQIAPGEMALLRDLRNQAVLAIKQKTQG
jgi:eukaryotic-like serine/threonine-protein kinase